MLEEAEEAAAVEVISKIKELVCKVSSAEVAAIIAAFAVTCREVEESHAAVEETTEVAETTSEKTTEATLEEVVENSAAVAAISEETVNSEAAEETTEVEEDSISKDQAETLREEAVLPIKWKEEDSEATEETLGEVEAISVKAKTNGASEESSKLVAEATTLEDAAATSHPEVSKAAEAIFNSTVQEWTIRITENSRVVDGEAISTADQTSLEVTIREAEEVESSDTEEEVNSAVEEEVSSEVAADSVAVKTVRISSSSTVVAGAEDVAVDSTLAKVQKTAKAIKEVI